MSDEIEKQRQKEVQERSGWCSSHKPESHDALPVKPIPGSVVTGISFLAGKDQYVEQCFPGGTSPGLALGGIFDAIQALGHKRVKAVRVYFYE